MKRSKIPFPSFTGGYRITNNGRTERETYPYSQRGEAEKLRQIGCFHDLDHTRTGKQHVSRLGQHRLYVFNHLSLVTHQKHRELITHGAAKLMSLTQFNCGYTRRHSPRYRHQLEMWPNVSEFDALVILTKVEFKVGTPSVFVDSAMLLAFDSMLIKFEHDKMAYDIHVADRERRGLKIDILPAKVPQLYFVDEKTGDIFCFGDADRKAFFGDRPIFQILSIFKYGQRVNIVRAKKPQGRLVLISMQIESKPEYRENPTDLCLQTLNSTMELIIGDDSSVVGIATYINLSGYTAVNDVEITSLVCRPQGTYEPDECPVCNPKSD